MTNELLEIVDGIGNVRSNLKYAHVVVNKLFNDYLKAYPPQKIDIQRIENEYETVSNFVGIALDYIYNANMCLNDIESVIESVIESGAVPAAPKTNAVSLANLDSEKEV